MTALMPRPQMRSDLVLHNPEEGGAWVIEKADGTMVRVGQDAALLLQSADGHRTTEELAGVLGPQWTSETVEKTLHAFAKRDLIVTERASAEKARKRERVGRVEYRAPFALQLTLLTPKAWFERHQKAMRVIASNTTGWLMGALGVLGLMALAINAARVMEVTTSPVSLRTIITVGIGFVLLTSLHEFGHAAALAAEGVGARRIGIMLFYLSPALFCDATDGWILPRNAQRTRVALAGGVTSLGLAGAISLFAFLFADGSQVAVLLAVSVFAGSLFNLVPFIKLDGYIALMTWLDLPNLRSRSLDAFMQVTSNTLFGSRAPALAGPKWMPAFGGAVAVFTTCLLVFTSIRLNHSFATMGKPGAVMSLALTAMLVYVAVKNFGKLVKVAIIGGANPVRFGVVLMTVLGIAVGLLGSVEVNRNIVGGYLTDDTGVYFVTASESDARQLSDATASVDLNRAGLLGVKPLGSAVAGSAVEEREVPYQAVLPSFDSSIPYPAWLVPLNDVDLSPDATSIGGAQAHLGTASAASYLLDNYLTGPISGLLE